MTRVRLAPSPTGPHLHVGGARTALYNKLLADKMGGTFILRIEDTDGKRYNPAGTTDFIESLSWLGLNWTEGPSTQDLIDLDVPEELARKYGKIGQYSYVQSKRTEIYKEYCQQLMDRNLAYPVFEDENNAGYEATDDEDSKKRKALHLDGWRNATPFMLRKALATGNPYHVRIKLPRDGVIMCKDTLRGDLTFRWYNQFDRVIMKSDGTPTYHFASIVDDHLMEITDVLRGSEWLPSLPVHQYLYDCFDWEPPKFTHLSVILSPTGKGKMSKRKDESTGKSIPVFVEEYKRSGFLADALNNFMALVGWNPGHNKEFMKYEDMVELFSLNRLSKVPGKWDINKLIYMNHKYISNLGPEKFANIALNFV